MQAWLIDDHERLAEALQALVQWRLPTLQPRHARS